MQGLFGVLREAHYASQSTMRRAHAHSAQRWGWNPRRMSRPPCRLFSTANPSIESSNVQYEIRNVPGELAEELSDLLLANGALSATIVEHRPAGANEEEIFKEKFGSRYVSPAHLSTIAQTLTPLVDLCSCSFASEFWKTCSVQVCYMLSGDVKQVHAQHNHLIQTALDWTGADKTVLGAIDISQGEEIKPMNWQQAILDEYQEIQIAENLKIVPTWSETDESPNPSADRDESVTSTGVSSLASTNPPTIIRLNPGIAFGTGDHPTTRMCLQWINTLRDSNAYSLLDYGSGSGILAIAALVLNAARTAIGTDIEPLAIKASAHNAEINSVGDRFAAHLIGEAQDSIDRMDRMDRMEKSAADAAEHTHDIIVANILQGPLTQLAPRLAAHAHRGTLLGLSGITSNQVEDIQKAYEDVGFRNFITQTDDRDTAVTPMGHRWVLLTAVFDPTN